MKDSLYVFVTPQRLKTIKKNVSLYGLIVEKNLNSFWMTVKSRKNCQLFANSANKMPI